MKVIFFDGDCAFCNFWVKTTHEYDRAHQLKLVPLKSPVAKALLGEQASGASVLFLDGKKLYHSSTAALHITRHLGGLWPALSILLLIPVRFRDLVYRWLAGKRYLFGQSNSCLLPNRELFSSIHL